MDFNQLHYFIVTAETEHLTLASERLDLSQSALSRAIQNLESELGVLLFDRTGRGIKLNHFGRQFYHRALDLTEKLAFAQKELLHLADPDFGMITLGFTHTLGFSFVPELLKGFRQAHPKNQFSFRESRTNELLELVKSDELEIGLAVKETTDTSLTAFPIATEKMVLLLSHEHPLSPQSDFDFSTFTQDTFIHFDRGTSTRLLVDQYLAKHKAVFARTIDGLEIASILGLVEANIGIAIVPQSVVRHLTHIRVYPLELERTVYAVYKKQGFLTDAAKRFLSFLMQMNNKR
ncbi:LysR family transcriptional regulator [Listeria floridensis FSL S10-1187]|uniref:LysR family transcriptional regulator n=1 Tax=Listeria floridensis FSL S10-1187 TaxID=1265817 RepID=A0ABP3AYQ6_9LIST|nr:LysR family transcriptional regulator [Listeria floridensis]EUJ30649.1 LysR family transcriptional regulator [Listeria floridensis FSL S10-1187]